MISSPLKLKYLNQSLLVNNEIGLTAPLNAERDLEKRTAKWILLALRHIAPPVVYIDAGLSYLADG